VRPELRRSLRQRLRNLRSELRRSLRPELRRSLRRLRLIRKELSIVASFDSGGGESYHSRCQCVIGVKSGMSTDRWRPGVGDHEARTNPWGEDNQIAESLGVTHHDA
jgi:hypothetical protein